MSTRSPPIDCSLIPLDDLKTWVIQAKTIGAAATQLCQPFGIAVTGDGMSAPLPTDVPFTITPGETVFQMLEYMARTAQVLLWDDANGNLVISTDPTGGIHTWSQVSVSPGVVIDAGEDLALGAIGEHQVGTLLLVEPKTMVLSSPVEIDGTIAHRLERTFHTDRADINVGKHDRDE